MFRAKKGIEAGVRPQESVDEDRPLVWSRLEQPFAHVVALALVVAPTTPCAA